MVGLVTSSAPVWGHASIGVKPPGESFLSRDRPRKIDALAKFSRRCRLGTVEKLLKILGVSATDLFAAGRTH